jgi:hypothetical protein
MRLINNISIGIILITFFSCGEGGEGGDNKTNGLKTEKSDTTKVSTEEEVYAPEIIKGKVTKSLTAGETAEISSIYFEFYKIDDKSPNYLKSVNELISKTVQNDFEEEEKLDITSNLTKNYFANILADFKKSFLEVGDEFMPWSIIDSIHINDSKANFVHLESFTYSFTGGAHGNGYEGHYLVSKETGKSLNLSDVINNQKKINSLVDQYFRKSQGLSANESLEDAGWFIEGRLKANNNFYFTDNNLVFVYNSYEIGPYAAGAPIVEIPISKIKPLLKLNLD